MTEKPGKASIVFKILYVGFFAVFILVIVINGLCSDWEWRYNYQPGTQFDKSIELTYRRYPPDLKPTSGMPTSWSGERLRGMEKRRPSSMRKRSPLK